VRIKAYTSLLTAVLIVGLVVFLAAKRGEYDVNQSPLTAKHDLQAVTQ